ncbi:MAG: hypothetical protein QNJ62_06195 [Methyloceanibacter sp.]|nr:hypothetical protein [Methyloceanibacter sp.]
MPTVPTYQRRQTIDTGRGSAPNFRQDGRVGRALQGLGNSLAGAGAALDQRYIQQQQELERFNTLKAESDFISNENAQFRTATENMQPGAPKFAETNLQEFDKRANEYLATVPERLRPEAELRLARRREQVSGRLASAESAERNRYYRSEVKDRLDDLTRDIQEQPEALDDIIASGTEYINSTGLAPAEKEAQIKVWEDLARKEQFKTQVRRNPELRRQVLQEQEGTGSFVDKVVGVESGGNPNAKNPKSTATGLGQFIDSTWMSTVTKHRPDLLQGRTRAQVLALRANPQISREMIAALANDNAKYLESAGQLPTEGNLYLAHFAGPAGAVAVLRAPREASAVSVLGTAVVKANPFLKGKTAGWVVDWAARKMGGKSAGSAIPENFGADDADEIRSYAASVERGQQAQFKRLQTERNDAVNLGIVTGQVTEEQTILSDPVLDDGQKAARLNQLRGLQDDLEQAQAGINAIRSGVELNPLDSKSRSVVDKGFSQLLEAEDQAVDSEYGRQLAEETARRTGIVPRSYATAIRGDLLSQDPQQVARALQNAQRIIGVSPSGLQGQDGAGKLFEAASWFRHAVNNLGMTDQEAAARFIRNTSPEFKRTREQLKTEIREFKKELDVDDLTSALDDVTDLSTPSLGQTLQQEQAIMGEYVELAEEAFVDTGGDPEAAKAIAIDRMKRMYGVSKFGGGNFIMRYPIEKAYRAVGGSHDYIADQARADIKSIIGADVDQDKIIIQSIPRRTEAAITAGQPAPYTLMWIDEKGLLQYSPQAFVADPEAVVQRAPQPRGQSSRNRTDETQLERSTRINEENRQREAERQRRTGELEDLNAETGIPRRSEMLGERTEQEPEEPTTPVTDPVAARRQRRRR